MVDDPAHLAAGGRDCESLAGSPFTGITVIRRFRQDSEPVIAVVVTWGGST